MYRDFCSCSQITVPSTNPICEGDCIFAPHMLLYGDESPKMCGETKTVLWDDKCLDKCGCKGGIPKFKLGDFTDNVSNVSVNSNGITFTSAWVEGKPQIATISYIMYCNKLSDRGTLTIIFNNPCINVWCPEGYGCNHCNGECVSMLDLDVTINK